LGFSDKVSDLKAFLSTVSYYRRHIPRFAHIAAPLNRLEQKGVDYVWTEECDRAFNTLKRCLTAPPILAFPRSEDPFVLDTDASSFAVGAILGQVQEGAERVVAYASRMLSRQERRYCATRREMLALVYGTREFRPYLLGRRFTVRTDHNSLVWLQNFKDAEGQVAR
jgi:hypothetical protein